MDSQHSDINLPIKLIDNNFSSKGFVINDNLKAQVNELKDWLHYNKQPVDDNLKKGYQALFFGPAGSGKTSTAAMLGKDAEKDVYKVDLTQIVSKYIGETEKNLDLLFARAEDKNWILFFDEADALFGKRTEVKDSHGRYTELAADYLLQRIENYRGMVIVAAKKKDNIHEAFTSRFQSIIHF